MGERSIAIGYDESIGYDPDDDDNLTTLIRELTRQAEKRRSVPIILEQWPPEPLMVGRYVIEIGVAAYFNKPIVILYRVGVEVPEHLRKLAVACVGYDTDNPFDSSTVMAMMARYA